MRPILRTLRTQWLGAIGLLVGVTGVALGATGQPALLGKLNQADKPTAFENTANGTAATFKTKSTQPPFQVTSPKQVPNLNASKVGGKLPSAFAAAGASYTKGESDTRFIDATEIGNYYTKNQANAAFAPAAGSPNYAPAGSSYTKAETDALFGRVGAVQVDFAYLDNVTIGAMTFDQTKRSSPVFFAPVAGTITATAWGTCGGVATTYAYIDLAAGVTSDPLLLNGGNAPCSVTASRVVAAGVPVVATLKMTNSTVQSSEFSLVNWLVTFAPS